VSSVVGVDLGGTKVAAAALVGRELGESLMRPTDCSAPDAVVDQLVSVIEGARPVGLDAVGIGVPSVVDFETGRVVSSVNIPLADVRLREVLGERLGVPVFVDNDATVAALAEAHDEQLRLIAHHLVMLTVGTGVGGGIVLGGRIYRGATGAAGELGHTLVGVDVGQSVPPATRFPQPGSLEAVAAGHALDVLAAGVARSEASSALGRLDAEGKPVRGPEAVQAARDGDPAAARVVERWGERLGLGIANAINAFDPDEVVIGGGGIAAGDLLLEPARRVALQYVLPGVGRRTTIRLARHGRRAGVLGAALLAAQELEALDASGASSADVRSGGRAPADARSAGSSPADAQGGGRAPVDARSGGRSPVDARSAESPPGPQSPEEVAPT
jgi:glucokinase